MPHPSRRVRLLLLLGLLVPVIAAVGETTQLVEWTEGFQLHWSLFLASPPPDASPNDPSGIHIELKWHSFHHAVRSGSNWTGCVSSVIVTNVMNPKLSWVRKDLASDAALRHATYHFRLFEVYREKLEAALLAVRVPARTSDEALELVYNRACQVADGILDRAYDVRQQYELETSSGTNAVRQQSWEGDIDAWLVNPALAP